MMKRILLGLLLAGSGSTLAMAADLMVEPAPVVEAAAPAISGDVEVFAGVIYLDDYYEDESFNGSTYGAAGRISIPVGSDFSIQLDASAEAPKGIDGDDYSVWNLAGHVSWRQDGNLLGVFASYGQDHDWWDADFATVGLEGIATLDNLQLYGQVGYSTSVTDGEDENSIYGRGEARYFLTPNFEITGSAGLFRTEYSGDDVINGVTWGAALEYRFDDSPISLFTAYEGSYSDEPDEEESWAVHTLKVGARFSFGSDTLQDAATNGATLRDYNPFTGYAFDRYGDFE